MNYRLAFSLILGALSVAVAVCGMVAFRSKKAIGVPLGRMLFSLLPPVVGNLLIIASTARLPATVGHYMYYVGIDFTVFGALRYVLSYCNISWRSNRFRVFVLTLLGLDVLQLVANIWLGHAFALERIQLFGGPYYRMIPYFPQQLHRALAYCMLAAALGLLLNKMLHSSRMYSRRYGVIFFSMLAVVGWCSFYVVSRTPMDRSMIGYAVFGLLAFYFSLYYKPVRLLNRIMVDMAAELPDALFFFDDAGECIWLNRMGRALLDLRGQDLTEARGKLAPFFAAGEGDRWTASLELDGEGGKRYYALEKRTVRDNRGYVDGSFLNVRDDTEAQLNLLQETYRARHDELTGLYTRLHLYDCIRDELEKNTGRLYCVVFANVSGFKLVNDIFGMGFGDSVLRHIADLLRRSVPKSGIYGRLGGDTFGIFLPADDFDAEKVEKSLTSFTVSAGDVDYHVLVHVGVYEVSDATLDISVMFDRARIAASSLRNDYHTHIAWYDDAMRVNMLWEQQISGDLHEAIRQRQIVPYLQPLVDQSGRVVGAEALVRWNHPEHGFLPPCKFVPVFERNGMIAEVDRHMWRCACEQLARWRDNDLFIIY